jgi:AcrR family transcriptional regulator
MSIQEGAPRLRGRPRLDDRLPGQPTTRDRILEAAADLFAERGFASASMSAIAEQADLTTGALYGHFEGKAELLLAVVERALRELPMTKLLEVPDRPVPDLAFLPRMASEYAAPQLGRLRRLAVEVNTAAGRDKRVAELVTDSNLRVARAVRAVLDQALGPGAPSSDKDRDYAARMLLVVVMGLQHLDTLDSTLIGDPDWVRYLEAGVARLLELPPATSSDE